MSDPPRTLRGHEEPLRSRREDALAEALAPMADVLTGVETSPDAQSIDVWSVPTAEPLADLGWLGQMAREPCLIEPYSGTVKLDEVRDCLRKQLGRYHELQNKDAALWKNVPTLWILSTGRPRPEGALELGFEPASDWPRGFYRIPAPWRAFLVVRNELPRERATLILRATGTGRVLMEAIEDVLQEPADSRGIWRGCIWSYSTIRGTARPKKRSSP